MATWIQDLQIGIGAINSISPMGAVVILIIGWVILPRLKFLQRFLKGIGWFANPYQEIQPVLMKMATTIEKIDGNDLSHLKRDIEALGSKMDSIDQRFISHDDQAKAILSRTNDVWEVVKGIKK